MHTLKQNVVDLVPGLHGDLRAEYSGIEMSTGRTQAIWGVVELKGAYLSNLELT